MVAAATSSPWQSATKTETGIDLPDDEVDDRQCLLELHDLKPTSSRTSVRSRGKGGEDLVSGNSSLLSRRFWSA